MAPLVWLLDADTIRVSPDDPRGASFTVCPVAALREWITAAPLRSRHPGTDPLRDYRQLLLRQWPWLLGRN